MWFCREGNSLYQRRLGAGRAGVRGGPQIPAGASLRALIASCRLTIAPQWLRRLLPSTQVTQDTNEDAWMQEHPRTRQHVHHGEQVAPHGGVHSGGGHDGVEI